MPLNCPRCRTPIPPGAPPHCGACGWDSAAARKSGVSMLVLGMIIDLAGVLGLGYAILANRLLLPVGLGFLLAGGGLVAAGAVRLASSRPRVAP